MVRFKWFGLHLKQSLWLDLMILKVFSMILFL